MHELSIALRIVETLTEELADTPGVVTVVYIRVGALSGVVPDALRFAWDAACSDSRLQGSLLDIEEVAPVVHCPRCQADRQPQSIQCLQCPQCGQPTAEVVAGRELHILSVEVADDGETG